MFPDTVIACLERVYNLYVDWCRVFVGEQFVVLPLSARIVVTCWSDACAPCAHTMLSVVACTLALHVISVPHPHLTCSFDPTSAQAWRRLATQTRALALRLDRDMPWMLAWLLWVMGMARRPPSQRLGHRRSFYNYVAFPVCSAAITHMFGRYPFARRMHGLCFGPATITTCMPCYHVV
jgi:hypothetical protein